MLKKYSIAALFSLLLIFTGFTGGAFAQNSDSDITPELADAVAEVEKVNEKIYAEIDKVQTKADKIYANYLEEKARTTDEQKKADAWDKYEEKIEAEIAKLQEKTERITNKGIEKATAAGLKVKMYLIDVEFADRIRKIDPLKVIGW